MIRIHDIKKWERCDKLLWLSKKTPQPFVPFIYYHEDLYELAKQKLHLQNYMSGQVGDDNEAFFEAEQHYDAFVKMRFTYRGLRIRIPIMKKAKNGYHLYFLFAACFPKEGEAQAFADQVWVLHKLGIKVAKVKIIHLNSEYVRGDTLYVDQLLQVSEHLFNDKNHPGHKIKQLMKQKQRDVEEVLQGMDHTLQLNTLPKVRTNICTKKNKCPYFDVCFPTPNKDTSILNLVSSAHKFSMLEQGVEEIDQLDFAGIEGTRHQFAQYMAAVTNQMFFDTYAVEHFLQSITYPISYLDFEWETYAYPPFKGMRPFDVLTFQYSLHIETKDHTIEHQEYLGRQDCRVAFVESLIAHMPKTGSVICFNVEGAEKLRLKQLAKQFPQYYDDLKQIWERMIDLSIPFSNGLVYDNRMAGMYSLKKLVAIFTDYDYNDLDISHGMDAVRNYRLLDEEDAKQQKATLDELLAYCAMDTYAMVLIYHFLLSEIKKRKRLP